MKVYIDFDDVLCETARALAEMAERFFGACVPYEAIEAFDLRTSFQLDEAAYLTLMQAAHHDDFLLNLTPAPDAVPALKALIAGGVEPVIVTGRPPDTQAVSLAWLALYDLRDIPIVHLDKYGRWPSGGAVSLAEFNAMHFDAAVEDSPQGLDLLSVRTNCTVIVFDRPWNRNYSAPGLIRCRHWPAIVEYLL